MKVLGVLVEGADGKQYLLGTAPRQNGRQTERPTISRRADDGTFISLELTREGSATIREKLGMQPPLMPGLTHDEHVKYALLESVARLQKDFFADARW
jgi:hypothetical protein